MINPYDEISCDVCGLCLGYATGHDMNGGRFYCPRHVIEDIFNGNTDLADVLEKERFIEKPVDIEKVKEEEKMIKGI